MTLESPVPEAVKGWSDGMCREVGVIRKTEFPTQNICFGNFTFSASSYCYLREAKTEKQEETPPQTYRHSQWI